MPLDKDEAAFWREQQNKTQAELQRVSERIALLESEVAGKDEEITRHAKVHEETIFMLNDERGKVMRLEAALGRAVAALRDLLPSVAGGPYGEGKTTYSSIVSILADPDCKAADEYVAALEREHGAVKEQLEYWNSILEFGVDAKRGAKTSQELRQAYAAVEARKAVKP